MKLPRLELIILPRTMEGYRGAFFGTLLSLFLDYFGLTTALIAVIAFAIGLASAPFLTDDAIDKSGNEEG